MSPRVGKLMDRKAAARRWKAIMDEQKRYSWIQVGTIVDYHSIIGGPITKAAMVVRKPAQRLPGGQWVCWLRGKAGCVSCDSVTPVAT
jgi:hypothetical protein